MPTTGPLRDATRRLERGVVETGDDEGVEAFGLAFDDFLDHARRGEGFVEIALDRGRAAGGIDRADLVFARAAAAPAAAPMRAVMLAEVLGLTTSSRMAPHA